MQEITRVRFEALAAYCRKPEALVFAEEVGWFQVSDEKLLIVLIRDRPDNDFSAIVLAKDLKERYRWVSMTDFYESPEEALSASKENIREISRNLDAVGEQGDEVGKSVDFFSPVVLRGKLNKDFICLTTLEEYSPALELIKPMMRWYEDADGNFVEQFQTTGFDARIWELYVFAVLIELGYVLDRTVAIPDFVARGVLGDLCVEATTVNPTLDKRGRPAIPPPLETWEDNTAYQCEYMPIKFAGPLTAKLAKKYWERSNVKGLPLIFAIQDFHAPMSMTMTRAGLPIYLYGYAYDWNRDWDGTLVLSPRKVVSHKWGGKEVPSGFFGIPGAENVSAVISNTSATISKFNRIGLMAGFGSKRVHMIRRGFAADFDPNAFAPRPFVKDVSQSEYSESWVEGMDVYHNPFAKYPLDPSFIPGAAHHRLLDGGKIESFVPSWQPLTSFTHITLT
ncbi:MAG: hypothetical protein IPK02_16490 [Candidatus Accumulibacter sp.]|uniref:Glycosaminoglycan attachment site n=1 Tax=Candidatus Accumulibacter affinis TaxID=2954384 RepID=A0A935W5P5_9PROT|nr:hypothetical protein [Candidatus Accumulibacter affinis]